MLLTEKGERKLYIVGDAFPEKVKNNLENVVMVGNDMVRINTKNKIRYFFRYILQLVKLKKTYLSKLNKFENNIIYGATIFAPLFAKKNDVFVIEDGTGSYIKKEDLKHSTFLRIKKILHRIFLQAEDNFHVERKNYIKKIFYTGIGDIPEDVLHKSIIINLEELWRKKDIYEQDEILNIFNLDKQIIADFTKRKIILFTQTLNEDGFVETENQKIEIYRKALENEDLNNVIVKPHPREKTNYEKYFPGIKQIEGQIPFQLLSLIGIKVEKAITLFSTAVLSFPEDISIVWYGTTLSDMLHEKYGEIPITKYRQ